MTANDPSGSPWHTNSAEEKYRNPWITVTEYQVTRPDGKPGIYGVVDPGDNVTIVALDDAGNVRLQREFLYILGREELGLPTGKVEDGEELLVAAQRELAEEAGLTATRWDVLGSFPLSPGITTQVSYIYLARDLTAVPTSHEGTEQIEPVTMPLDEAYAACLRGEIRCAVSVLGIWRAYELVRRGV